MTDISTVFAVLDTNDFLEHRRFTEIDWCELLKAARVVLVVPWQVVAELDDNKSNNRSPTKRERARELLPLIEHYAQLAKGEEIRPSVTMEFFSRSVDDTCNAHDLSASAPDQVIIASAICFRDSASGTPVVLVTGDTGMRMTARRVGLTVFAMPESLRLPNAPDEEERERRHLERELRRFQTRQPALQVGWADGSRVLRTSIRPVALTPALVLDGYAQTRVAKLAPPPRHIFGQVENPRYSEALSLIADFHRTYRQYLDDLESAKVATSLTFESEIWIRNDGTKAATDVNLQVQFPDLVTLSDSGPEIPTEPEEPRLNANIFEGPAFPPGLISIPSFHPPTISSERSAEMSIQGERGVRFHVRNLQHSYAIATPTIYVTFSAAASIQSFGAKYHLVADDLLEPVEGELSVVLGEAAADAAHRA